MPTALDPCARRSRRLGAGAAVSRGLVVGPLVLATLAIGGAAHAQPGPRVAASDAAPALTWRAPVDCPDTQELQLRLEQRLERSLDEVTLGVEVDVSFTAGNYVARVDLAALTVANDIRTLRSKRCSELADAVALVVARAAGEMVARRAVAIRADADRDDLDRDEPIVAGRSSPIAHSPTAPRSWTLGARVSGVSGIGVIPKVGLGGELALTLRRHDRLAELAATKWVDSVAQFVGGRPSSVEVYLDATALRYGWRPYELPLRAWLGVEVGSMRGAGVELPSQQFEGGRWIAAGAGFGIAWQMKPWIRLLGTIEGMVAIERVRFTQGDGIVAYAPSPMSVRTTCGLEIGWQ